MIYKTVVIRKIKRPDGLRRWPAYELGEDRHGLWLYSPKGTIFRGQQGAEIGECAVGGYGNEGRPVLHLIPRDAWWMAAWCEGISVDICTAPSLIDGEWHYIDLELDVIAHGKGHVADGRVHIDDEDEFLAACEAGLISRDEAKQARDAATEMEQCLRLRTEPFGRLGWDKLDKAIGLCLPAIRKLRHVSTA